MRDADVEYSFDDPDEGWFGMARPVDTAPARPVDEAPRPDHVEYVRADDPPVADQSYQGRSYAEQTYDPVDEFPSVPHAVEPEYREPEVEQDAFEENADTDRWYVQDMGAAALVEPDPEPVRPQARTAPAPSWESRLSNSGAWDFKATSGGARYRWKPIVLAAAAIAVVAAVVGIVLLLTGPSADDRSPTPTPSAPATTATTAPALSSPAPLPPPPPPAPPPPPPPSAEEVNPPVITRQYSPNYQTPDEPKKPQTNVTRSPLSAAPPPPPQQTDKGRATPGESGHHGFFG